MVEEIVKEINLFAAEREWDQFHTPKNIASSISIEAAELLECFQWDNPSISEVLENEVKKVSLNCVYVELPPPPKLSYNNLWSSA